MAFESVDGDNGVEINDTDIDASLGELIFQIEQLRENLRYLSITQNGGNKLFVDINTIIGGVINRVDVLTTLANQTNVGGMNAFAQVKALSDLQMNALLEQITPP